MSSSTSFCYAEDIEPAHTAYIVVIAACAITIPITLFFIISLTKNLFYVKWNHLPDKTPSLRIKVLAISMPSISFISILLVLIYTIIAKCNTHWGTIYFIEYGLKDHLIEDAIMCIVFTLTGLNWPLYPSFILAIIHNFFSKNKSAHQVLENSCCKYFYCNMSILVIMEPVLYTSAILTAAWKSCYASTICEFPDRYMIADKMLITFGAFYLVIDIVIHISLITVLFKGFHKMSAKYYNRKYEMDNRGHENIVEMTRYFVTFGTYTIIYTLLNIIGGLVISYPWAKRHPHLGTTWISGPAVFGYIVIKEITAIICIYLSFEWNHIIYERICCCCDKCCKKRMETFEMKRRNDTIKRHLIRYNESDMVVARIGDNKEIHVNLDDDHDDLKNDDYVKDIRDGIECTEIK